MTTQFSEYTRLWVLVLGSTVVKVSLTCAGPAAAACAVDTATGAALVITTAAAVETAAAAGCAVEIRTGAAGGACCFWISALFMVSEP